MAPNHSAIQSLQVFGKTQLSQRIRSDPFVVGFIDPVVLADKYDHLSFYRPLINSVNVSHVGRQTAPESVDLHWIGGI